MFCFFMGANGYGQEYDPLEGPYEDYAGPYHIRLAIHFEDNIWTINEMDGLAAKVFSDLNTLFNPHEIYFYDALSSGCGSSYDEFTIPPNFPTFFASQSDDHILDIFFEEGSGSSVGGISGGVPSTYSSINGGIMADLDETVAVVIHEVGHCLGLYHIFTDTQVTCSEETGSCTNSSSPDICNCCGDHVCDTPNFPNGGTVNVNSSCTASTSPTGIDPAIFTNYMSYTDPGKCRDHFSAGQIARIWDMLATHPTSQAMLNTVIDQNTVLTGGFYGNLIVEGGAELEVNGTIEMLPGTYIYVEKGAQLTVRSTITAACNDMWQGVIVEGSSLNPQTYANQGYVFIRPGGKIEHAKVGIDVKGFGPASGGGIVKGFWAVLENNEIGLRFAQYVDQNAVNACFLIKPDFLITDDYRGTERPILFQAEGIRQPRIYAGDFKDLRTTCTNPNDMAIGAELLNASVHFGSATVFENLSTGILADQIDENNGSFSIQYSEFKNCKKGIHSIKTSDFSLIGNDFTVRRPTVCPSPSSPATGVASVVGVRVDGLSSGFTIKGNDFTGEALDFALERITGIYTLNTGEGMGKEIIENTFSSMFEGVVANGSNAGDVDGILYLCNNFGLGTLFNGSEYWYDFHVFSGSTVKTIQGNLISTNIYGPTRNVFSEERTFYNEGPVTVSYYHTSGVSEEDPDSGDPLNITAISVAENPMTPTCPVHCSDWHRPTGQWLFYYAKKTVNFHYGFNWTVGYQCPTRLQSR